MYPFSCVLWAIFWSFSLLFSENASKTHPKSSHDKFKTASECRVGEENVQNESALPRYKRIMSRYL